MMICRDLRRRLSNFEIPKIVNGYACSEFARREWRRHLFRLNMLGYASYSPKVLEKTAERR
jgi:hypothetical protein